MIERMVIGEHIGDEWTINFGEYNHETDVTIPKSFALELLKIKEEFNRLKSRNEELERDKDNLLHSVERLGEWRDDIQKRFDERYATPNEHEKHLIAQPLREEISRLKAELHEATLRASEYKTEWESALYREQGLKAENADLKETVKLRLREVEEEIYQKRVLEQTIDRLSSALVAAHEALKGIMYKRIKDNDALEFAEYVLADKDGTLAFEKWKKMGAVVEAARACYEEDDFITENSPGSFERDKKLGEALEALDANGERE